MYKYENKMKVIEKKKYLYIEMVRAFYSVFCKTKTDKKN